MYHAPLRAYQLEAEHQFNNNVISFGAGGGFVLTSKVLEDGIWKNRETILTKRKKIGDGSKGTVYAYESEGGSSQWVERVVFKQVLLDGDPNEPRNFPSELLEAVLTKYFGDLGIGAPCDASRTFAGRGWIVNETRPAMNLFVARDIPREKMFIIINRMDYDLEGFFRAINYEDTDDFVDYKRNMLEAVQLQLRERLAKMLNFGFLCVDVKARNVLVDAENEQFYLSDFDPRACCSFEDVVLNTVGLPSRVTETPCEEKDIESYKAITEGIIAMTLVGVLESECMIFRNSLNKLGFAYLYEFLKGTLYALKRYEAELGSSSSEGDGEVRGAIDRMEAQVKTLEEAAGLLLHSSRGGGDAEKATPFAAPLAQYGMVFGTRMWPFLGNRPEFREYQDVIQRARTVLERSSGTTTYRALGHRNASLMADSQVPKRRRM